jgi:hypothetical protein
MSAATCVFVLTPHVGAVIVVNAYFARKKAPARRRAMTEKR